ncbi:FG-GAP repeat protein [Desulfamplus magnetovallimortis]|uniref:FG-GAP repeat protein n=1 Tax=Desulfamplus magnetovallimortis TaxID=1246637 RepID=A0A1W1H5F8_9BACT|nr:VCBS repeat-containing protein [Desulfamplus magnetovallimortis]SLM27598.1 FG-GAP repeat protein [Desulfamplus magnetovallimortis]
MLQNRVDIRGNGLMDKMEKLITERKCGKFFYNGHGKPILPQRSMKALKKTLKYGDFLIKSKKIVAGCKAVIFFMCVLMVISISFSVSALETPRIKWQNGGCFSSWCETGWYSSPAVADLDEDGKQEVIGASYSIFVLNGEDGSLKYRVDPEGGRVWPGVVVADIDGDGHKEFATAHGSGYLHLFNHDGTLRWTVNPISRELRGLSACDLDGDGSMELVVTGAVSSKVNTWVYEHDGSLRNGWPQLADESGYAYGVFNDNAAVGDLDGDGSVEIIVPSDVHYICAYDSWGTPLPTNEIYGDKAWGKVGVWESLEVELRGWGECGGERKERYRTNFAHGAALMCDFDKDGVREIVATGNVYDCAIGHPPGQYNGIYIFNSDRSRFKWNGLNWEDAPVDTGSPLTEDYNIIENNQPNPIVADLDGDGIEEILYSSYDGKVHAFWLDKTEHGEWPFSVHDSSEGYMRFASEPVASDLDGDGSCEVLFTSWVEKGSGRTGDLFVLNSEGKLLHRVPLPEAYGSPDWNGGLAAPTLADIDGDPDLEIIVNTAHSGFVAYDLPGTSNAVVHWGTGRGNMQRTGIAPTLTPTPPEPVSPQTLKIELN